MTNFSIIQKSQLESATRIDAEYYQPEFLNIKNIFGNKKTDTVRDLSLFVKKGIFDISPNKYKNSGIPLVRVQNIKNGIIDYLNMVYLADEDHEIENKTELSGFDFVFSKVGTVGEVAFLDPKYPKWNFSQNVLGIKLDKTKIDSAYILFYFLSKFGQLQIKRAEMGQVQPKLELEDIRNLKVARINEENKFNEYLDKILELRNASENYYHEAEDLLLSELGLKGFDNVEKLSSIVNFSDIESVHRIDAEYFQPKYAIIEEKIKKHNAYKLGDLVSMKKGIEVGAEEYHEEGKIFIRVSSMTKFGIVESDQKYLSDKLYESLKKDFEPKRGEILLTKDATLGVACVLNEDIQGIISGGTLRLQIMDKKVENEYLTLCLNSIIGQMQAERDAGGSIIAHWKPDQIKNVFIPVLPREIQKKISELVRQSHKARKKAKELLEEAKRKVEEMIEKGGENV
jgi:restriction endonuclease S subunit